jgi:hypothetical protein
MAGCHQGEIMKLKALKNFSWAHNHVRVADYTEGQDIDTEDADLIEVARREGWALPEGEEPIFEEDPKEPGKRAKKAAPENKAEEAAPENK